MPGWAESSRAPSHGGFVVFGVCLSVCQCVGGFMGPSSVLLHRYHVCSTPETWTEDRAESTHFLKTSKIYLENHEVAEKRRIGRHAGPGHLYLCLSYNNSHWYPTRRLVLFYISNAQVFHKGCWRMHNDFSRNDCVTPITNRHFLITPRYNMLHSAF